MYINSHGEGGPASNEQVATSTNPSGEEHDKMINREPSAGKQSNVATGGSKQNIKQEFRVLGHIIPGIYGIESAIDVV